MSEKAEKNKTEAEKNKTERIEQILSLAAKVYEGLSDEEIKEIEDIALNRENFFQKYEGNYKIIPRLQKEESGRNVVFTAIEKLKNEDEIIKFFDEYVQYLQESNPSRSEEKNKVLARHNIGYILGYYSDRTRELWKRALAGRRMDSIDINTSGLNLLSAID